MIDRLLVCQKYVKATLFNCFVQSHICRAFDHYAGGFLQGITTYGEATSSFSEDARTIVSAAR